VTPATTDPPISPCEPRPTKIPLALLLREIVCCTTPADESTIEMPFGVLLLIVTGPKAVLLKLRPTRICPFRTATTPLPPLLLMVLFVTTTVPWFAARTPSLPIFRTVELSRNVVAP